MWRLLLLMAPAALGIQSLITGKVAHKVSATLTSMLLVLLTVPEILGRNAPVLAVAAALAASSVGDWLLSTKGDRPGRFVAGIGAFLLAHAGFLVYALLSGRPSWIVLAAMLLASVLYYLLVLRRRIRPARLAVAALVYLVVSCVTVSASAGLLLPAGAKSLFVAGIVLLALSDTVISFVEFLGWKRWTLLILPTYYLAQLCVVASVMLLP